MVEVVRDTVFFPKAQNRENQLTASLEKVGEIAIHLPENIALASIVLTL